MINRALHGMDGEFGIGSRKATREQERRRLGHDDNAFANLAAKQTGRRRLAAARAAGENDTAAAVCVRGQESF